MAVGDEMIAEVRTEEARAPCDYGGRHRADASGAARAAAALNEGFTA
jgi:hypothetical protein